MKKTPNKDEGLDTLKSHLKQGNLGNLYLFHGEERYLRRFYLEELKKKALPSGAETFNFHEFEGKTLDLFQLEESIDAFPMMAERTFVLVSDWDILKLNNDSREKLMKMLEDLPDYCTLVFHYDSMEFKADGRLKLSTLLHSMGTVVDFPLQSEDKLVKWIQGQRFPAMGKEISSDLARELIFYCGESMTNLSTEVEKIGSYANGTEITKEDILTVATPHINAIVFSMTDAMAEKEFDRAIQILAELFQMQGKSKSQERDLGILGAISRQIRQIYQAKLAQGKGESYVASLLGVQSFIARKIIGISRRFSMEWCRDAVILCAETDRAMKSSKQNGEALLTQLLLDLAQG